MKALVLDAPGPINGLHIAEMPLSEPGFGEVRVKVKATGLNPVDYKSAAIGFPTWEYPFILGLDVAGVIDAIGENVTNWKAGDRVYYHGNMSKPGGYAEYSVITAKALAAIPDEVSFEEAAAIPCAGFTAYYALYRKLHIQKGQTILIHGGAGGVGGFAIQLASREGLTVYTSCQQKNYEYVRSLGAHHPIDYTHEDVHSRIFELTLNRGVDAIVDTISADNATADLRLLAFGGGIACVVGLPDCSRIKPFQKAVSIHEVSLGAAHLSGDRQAIEELGYMGKVMMQKVAAKEINPLLNEVIKLEDIPAALERLSKRHVRGKIVATLPD